MLKTIKQLFSLAALALATACGGGGGGTTYQVVFVGTVTGLATGQQLTLLATIPTTGQSIPITISQNGKFSSQITLPSGYDLTNYGTTNVIVSQQPTLGKCSIGFVTTAQITVNCSNVSGAAGLYGGPLTTPTITTGRSLVFIQNNGSYWMLVGNTNSANSITTYSGIIAGAGSSTTTTYASNNGVNVNSSPQLTGDTISATYQSSSTFTGSLIEQGVSYSLNLTSFPGYSFNATPLISNLIGTYKLGLTSKSPSDSVIISIGSSGSFNGLTANGCTITGNVTPMTTGENAYNFSLIFGQTPCSNPSTTQAGTVVQVTTTAGAQLIGGTFNTSMTDATILIGTKQ